jgi:hypothetical protein
MMMMMMMKMKKNRHKMTWSPLVYKLVAKIKSPKKISIKFKIISDPWYK